MSDTVSNLIKLRAIAGDQNIADIDFNKKRNHSQITVCSRFFVVFSFCFHGAKQISGIHSRKHVTKGILVRRRCRIVHR